MKLPKTHPRSGHIVRSNGFVLRDRMTGRTEVPPEKPAGDPSATDPGSGAGGDPAADPSKKAESKTFTQEDLNRVAAKQKAEGKAAAEKALADSLGVPLDEAKAIIKKAQDEAEAKKDEATKDREKAAKEKTEAEKLKGDAANELRDARIDKALAAEKFPDIDDDKKTEAVRRMVSVAADASYDDVREAVKELAKNFPGLFAAKEIDDKTGKPKVPNSDPKSSPTKPGAGEDLYEAGKVRARKLYDKRQGFDPLAPKAAREPAAK